jgi:amidase
MVDLIDRSAVEMLAELRARRVSARELLDAHLRRNDDVHAALNIVVDRDIERAQRDADAIDRARLRGEPLGALAGLPMTIKDGFDVEGMPAVVGNPEWRDRPKDCPDADVVATARRAGAVIWGKTNVSRLLDDWQSTNPVFGATNNPYDVGRTAGGSSGGSAAALATGVTSLEIGSDIGGSLRVPANFCGVYALKPTWDLLPQGGHLPPAPGVRERPSRDLNVVGPMARTPGDLRLLHAVLTGTARAPVRNIRGRRVGVWLDQPDFLLGRASRAAVERVADALEEVGADVRAVDLPISPAEMLAAYWDLIRIVGGLTDGSRLHAARAVRDRLKADMRAFFDDGWDAILAPVMAVTAFRHDTAAPLEQRRIDCDGESAAYLRLVEWVTLATSLHLPAVAVPAGRMDDGVPTGVQIVGRWDSEDGLVDFADALDPVFGFEPPPALGARA